MPSPLACLQEIDAALNPGGVIVLTSPFTWLEEYTDRAKWIGGRKDEAAPGGEGPLRCADALKGTLGAMGYTVLDEGKVRGSWGGGLDVLRAVCVCWRGWWGCCTRAVCARSARLLLRRLHKASSRFPMQLFLVKARFRSSYHLNVQAALQSSGSRFSHPLPLFPSYSRLALMPPSLSPPDPPGHP